MSRACSTYRERTGVYTCFWWGNLRERDHFEDSGIRGRMILRWIFRKQDVDRSGLG